MLLLLIFPVLVAGFVACHIHPVHAYKLHRYEGQYLYLKSAELGIKCFALGAALLLAAHCWSPDRLEFFRASLNLQLSEALVKLFQGFGARDASEALKVAWFFLFLQQPFTRPSF